MINHTTEETTMSTIKTIQINGEDIEVPSAAIAYKYADPTEGARWLTTEDEIREIEREDPSLIVHVPVEVSVQRGDVEVNAVATGKHLNLAVIRDGVIVEEHEQDAEALITEQDAKISANELLDALTND